MTIAEKIQYSSYDKKPNEFTALTWATPWVQSHKAVKSPTGLQQYLGAKP